MEEKNPPAGPAGEKKNVEKYLAEVNREFKEKEVQEKAKNLGFSYVDLREVAINSDVLRYLSRKQAEEVRCVPFLQAAKTLHIAFAAPQSAESKQIISELEQKNYTIIPYLASEESIKSAQELYYTSQYHEEVSKNIQVEESQISAEEAITSLHDLREKVEELSGEDALQLIHRGAIQGRASDIHLQPLEVGGVMRFRVDGMLKDIFRLSKESFEKIKKQIKYLSHLKLNITDVPQDGKYHFTINARQIDVRVAALPAEFGETLVLRILDAQKGILRLEDLGFRGKALEEMKHALQLPHGLLLVTGPTGSGKSTTLYSMLNILNTSEKKIITLEDPVEYHLNGIVQSEVSREKEYTFQSGLKAILRQDPDIIMVGEIRDHETAETALQAALTGHIVLSTLHTNSAIESIARLHNIGIPPYLIAPALRLVAAQRLVRRLCSCAEPRPLTPLEQTEIKKIFTTLEAKGLQLPAFPAELPSPIGCEKCSRSGYYGQGAIIEVVYIDDDFKELILAESSEKKLQELMDKKNLLTMKEDGLLKVLEGQTSLSEIFRVTL